MVRLGIGLTVIVKFCGTPGQPFWVGVTIRLAIRGMVPALIALKLIFPAPLAPRPMAVLEFVQLKVAPLVPTKFTITAAPAQTLWLAGAATVGTGLIVIVKFCVEPEQPDSEGVTDKFASVGAPTFAAVKLISPMPLAPNPMAVLALVQSKVAPAVPVKLTITAAPAQSVWLAGAATVGTGFTVIIKFCTAPTQPFRLGVTTKLAVNGKPPALVAKKLISPLPLAPRPILISEFVQSIVAEAVPVKFTKTCEPAQTL